MKKIWDESYLSFKELSASKQNETIQLQIENYRQFNYDINPLSKAVAFNKWKEIIVKGLAEANSYVWMKDEQIEAYLLSYEGEKEDSIDIGYIGGKDINV